jgi:hypothetical protein
VIVRQYVTCAECSTAHVLRIGLGGEPVQAHRFACTGCGEEMGIIVELGKGWSYGPNTEKLADEDDDAPIVNLHPSFVFPKEEIGSANAFPSLGIGKELIEGVTAARERAVLPTTLNDLAAIGPRRAPVTEEWPALRAAWSLHRSGKDALAAKRLAKFVPTAGYHDPPDTLADWVFQFAARMTQPRFEEHFEGLFQQVLIAKEKPDFGRFVQHYGQDMSAAHARRYFETVKDYLAAFSEFSQVHHLVMAGVEVGDGQAAASIDFDATRMFYGNAFEAFGDNVEFLTCINNLVEDRPFDELRTIALADYQRSDKAGRCRAIAHNPAMAIMCAEFDNQVRNAAHHGGMSFDRLSRTVEYRSGKGGQGEVRTMGYALYLARCSNLFAQTIVLLRLEILVSNEFGARLPL